MYCINAPGRSPGRLFLCLCDHFIFHLPGTVEDFRGSLPGQGDVGFQAETVLGSGCQSVLRPCGGFRFLRRRFRGFLRSVRRQRQSVFQHDARLRASDDLVSAEGLLIGQPRRQAGTHCGGKIGLEPLGDFVGKPRAGQLLVYGDVQRSDQHGDEFAPACPG